MEVRVKVVREFITLFFFFVVEKNMLLNIIITNDFFECSFSRKETRIMLECKGLQFDDYEFEFSILINMVVSSTFDKGFIF